MYSERGSKSADSAHKNVTARETVRGFSNFSHKVSYVVKVLNTRQHQKGITCVASEINVVVYKQRKPFIKSCLVISSKLRNYFVCLTKNTICGTVIFKQVYGNGPRDSDNDDGFC